MRGHIRKQGKRWAVVVDQGHQPARRCPGCKGVRIWVHDDSTTERCPRCGGTLAEAVDERRQRWHAYRTKGEGRDGADEVLGKLDTTSTSRRRRSPSASTSRCVAPEPRRPGRRGTLRPSTVVGYRPGRDARLPHLGTVPLRR